MAATQGFTEYLATPLEFFDADYHGSWDFPDTSVPWSSQRIFQDEKLAYSAGIMSSNNPRIYSDCMMDAPSPYPTPMAGSTQSPSLCSDDNLAEPYSSTDSSGWSPRVAELRLEVQRNPLDCQPCYPSHREYPLQQENALLYSDWTRTANIAGAHIQGIVCPKEVQIQSFADQEEGDMAYDEPNQIDYKSEHSYGQESPDTIVVVPRDPQGGRYYNDECDVSPKADSPSNEEDDDDAYSSYSGSRETRPHRNNRNPDPRSKGSRLTRKDSKSLKPGKVTKQRKDVLRCSSHAKLTFKNHSEYRKHVHTQHTRPFLCTFYFADCDQHFGSKNEWKRHVHSQHLLLGYWQCDFPSCVDRSNNNCFNRKDLFTQHLRRMHLSKNPQQNRQSSSGAPNNRTAAQTAPAEHHLPEIWKRCYRVRRDPPTSSTCGYCGKKFQGPGSWDERMEHVGHHYENSREPVNPSDWVEDKELIDWMLREGLIRRKEEDITMTEGGEPPRSRYTVYGTGNNKSSRRRSDDEFSDADKKRLGHRTLPPPPPPQRSAIIDVDVTSDVDAEAEEEE